MVLDAPATSERSQARTLRQAFSSIPARFAIGVFTLLIAIWTLLLTLPIASKSGTITPLPDALFTAVSAICVTGLTVVEHSSHWSLFGDAVILLGAQIGGIGVLSLASILGLTVTRRLGLKQRLLAQSEANSSRQIGARGQSAASSLGDMRGLLASVALSTLIIEGALMLLMYPQMLLAGYDPLRSLWYSGYMAITTFTNTGFVPMADGLDRFTGNYGFLGIMSLGVFLGAIGFPVIFSLYRYIVDRGWSTHKRFNLHVKLTLVTTIILTLAGWLVIGALEWQNPRTLGAGGVGEALMHSFYTSVMTRSGGFSLIDPSLMNGSTHIVLDMLMFVGGGSASTAGGIKVTTVAVLFLAAMSEARGYQDIQAFGRRIPTEVLRLAVSVVIWGATIVVTATIAITQISSEDLDRVLFEVISGFATCGLTTGLSAELPTSAKIILAATIWAGRVGTVTLASAVAASSRSRLYRLAEERPIVG
ncbi:TrkH family potassium uptake protein [Canibacter zhoujuaniae]|uniref:TrkH family potassium uptake protein n=1 Tax=Canibacter zhoujuaniae TaxID=2708343 RepID=UPI00142212A9|nr:potassium transporter TrkG [Canibacter zhoujuaniae]